MHRPERLRKEAGEPTKQATTPTTAAEGSTVAALHRTLGQLQTQQAIEEPGEQL